MKRALFVCLLGSEYLYFLRFLTTDKDPFFDAKPCEQFSDIMFYTADYVKATDKFVLDATGEELKAMGHNVYHAVKLGQPETPLEMARKTNENGT